MLYCDMLQVFLKDNTRYRQNTFRKLPAYKTVNFSRVIGISN
jgi:hypothetical protein